MLNFEVIDGSTEKVRKNVVYFKRGKIDIFGGKCHGAISLLITYLL
jgi:hypothetical protein